MMGDWEPAVFHGAIIGGELRPAKTPHYRRMAGLRKRNSLWKSQAKRRKSPVG